MPVASQDNQDLEGFRAARRPIYSHDQAEHVQGDYSARAAGALVPAGQLHVNCTEGRWSPCRAGAARRTTPLISLLAEVKHQLSLTVRRRREDGTSTRPRGGKPSCSGSSNTSSNLGPDRQSVRLRNAPGVASYPSVSPLVPRRPPWPRSARPTYSGGLS